MMSLATTIPLLKDPLPSLEVFPDQVHCFASMSSLTPEDIEALRSIGHDTVQNIVAVVVDAVLHSEFYWHPLPWH